MELVIEVKRSGGPFCLPLSDEVADSGGWAAFAVTEYGQLEERKMDMCMLINMSSVMAGTISVLARPVALIPGKPMAIDHVSLVTVSEQGVDIANLRMSGIFDKTGKVPLNGDEIRLEECVKK